MTFTKSGLTKVAQHFLTAVTVITVLWSAGKPALSQFIEDTVDERLRIVEEGLKAGTAQIEEVTREVEDLKIILQTTRREQSVQGDQQEDALNRILCAVEGGPACR